MVKVRVTNHSMKNVRPDRQPEVYICEVDEYEAERILLQCKACWLTHSAEIVTEENDCNDLD
jgi:hypothetical protein